eukprot:121768_1
MDTNYDQQDRLTMKVYLNDILIHLNSDQTLHIMDIIKPHPVHTVIKNDVDMQNEDRIQSEYVLDPNDTFLHTMFSNQNTQKIKQIVEHKLTLILGVIFYIFTSVIMWFLFEGSVVITVWNVYSITYYCLIGIPWIVFKHLLFNKVAFKLCLKTFDLWIKVIYVIIFGIVQIFLHFLQSSNESTLEHIIYCLNMAFAVFTISYVSSFDAVHSTKTKKLIMSLFGALVFSVVSMYSQFLFNEEDDYKIMIQLSNGVSVLSMQSLLASSSRIITIFMYRQSYRTWKSKGRAIAIFKSPKITWINATTTEHNLDQAIATGATDNEIDSVFTQKVPQIGLQPGSCKQKRNDANNHESESTTQSNRTDPGSRSGSEEHF